jgi:hypothetical protein
MTDVLVVKARVRLRGPGRFLLRVRVAYQALHNAHDVGLQWFLAVPTTRRQEPLEGRLDDVIGLRLGLGDGTCDRGGQLDERPHLVLRHADELWSRALSRRGARLATGLLCADR